MFPLYAGYWEGGKFATSFCYSDLIETAVQIGRRTQPFVLDMIGVCFPQLVYLTTARPHLMYHCFQAGSTAHVDWLQPLVEAGVINHDAPPDRRRWPFYDDTGLMISLRRQWFLHHTHERWIVRAFRRYHYSGFQPLPNLFQNYGQGQRWDRSILVRDGSSTGLELQFVPVLTSPGGW